RRARRRDARHHRPERRRQDHAHRPARRHAAARRRQHPLRRRGHHPPARAASRAHGPRALVPDHERLQGVHRAAERRAGGAGAVRTQLPVLAPRLRRCFADFSRGENPRRSRPGETHACPRRQPRARRAAPARGGDGAGDEAAPAAARRADGRHGRRGVATHDRLPRHAQAPPDHDPGRARHGCGVPPRRPDLGARLRPRRRHRRAGEDQAERGSAQGLPGRGELMLEVANLETSYGRSQVLFGVALQISRGEVVSLLGRNGMGKTTTVRSIMGIASCSGNIRFEGRELQRLPSYRIAKAGIGLVPEGRQIFPNLTVRENLVATATKGPWTLERVYGLFEHLKARRGNYGNQLSGGEQQMLAIGRALMTNPKLLILDEATEGLAPLVRAEIYRSIEKLKAQGLSILIIDKDVKALSRVAERHYVLEKGRVVWSGTSSELSASPEIQHRYLGV